MSYFSSRAGLNTLAVALGIDPSGIPNDSKLEQKIIWALKNTSGAVTGTAPTTTLTLSGNAVADETITVGGVTYTFKAAVTNTVPNQIKIGAAATNTLDNIKDAINCTSSVAVPGTDYSQATKRNPVVTAGAKNATTVVIAAAETNVAGATATTETMTNGAFTGANLSAGTAGIVADNTTGVKFTRDALSGGTNTSL